MLGRAPGRVDLLGAHVDYNDGHILALAVDRHVWVAADRAGRAGTTTLVALDLDEEVRFGLDRLDARIDADGAPLPTWARYPAGVAWALGEVAAVGAAGRLPDIEAVFAGDVPPGAGVSSSAALEVTFAAAWLELAGARMEPLELAGACRRAENEYVGVACGLMDQFCAVCGRRGRALLLDCRSLEWRTLPMPPRSELWLADTGTRRRLTDGALNDRQRECRQAVAALAGRIHGVSALRDVLPVPLEANAGAVPEPALSRARHIVAEEARVLQAAEALAAGDELRLGGLMDSSHTSARDLYDASGPALEAMWAAGHQVEACLGGRFIGAGFAGCVLFLVAAGHGPAFANEVGRRYAEATGLPPRITRVRAAAGASTGRLPGDPRGILASRRGRC